MVTHMSMKAIVFGIIGLIIIGIIGYVVVVGNPLAGAPAQQAQTATTTPQVQGQDVELGTGVAAKPGDTVSVLYEGRLSDGTVFDSSANNGNQPLTFVLGQPGIIPGFQVGVNGMKEGGTRNLAIPPELAYGTQEIRQNPNDPTSKVIIPANSTLVFQVKLVKVQASTSTPAQ